MRNYGAKNPHPHFVCGKRTILSRCGAASALCFPIVTVMLLLLFLAGVQRLAYFLPVPGYGLLY